MADKGREIADAIVAEIKATTFTTLNPADADVHRVVHPRIKIKDAGNLTVHVITGGPKDVNRVADGSDAELEVIIAVLQQAEHTNAAQDPLADFVQELEDHFGHVETSEAPRMSGGIYLSHNVYEPAEVKGHEWPTFTRFIRLRYRYTR